MLVVVLVILAASRPYFRGTTTATHLPRSRRPTPHMASTPHCTTTSTNRPPRQRTMSVALWRQCVGHRRFAPPNSRQLDRVPAAVWSTLSPMVSSIWSPQRDSPDRCTQRRSSMHCHGGTSTWTPLTITTTTITTITRPVMVTWLLATPVASCTSTTQSVAHNNFNINNNNSTCHR